MREEIEKLKTSLRFIQVTLLVNEVTFLILSLLLLKSLGRL